MYGLRFLIWGSFALFPKNQHSKIDCRCQLSFRLYMSCVQSWLSELVIIGLAWPGCSTCFRTALHTPVNNVAICYMYLTWVGKDLGFGTWDFLRLGLGLGLGPWALGLGLLSSRAISFFELQQVPTHKRRFWQFCFWSYANWTGYWLSRTSRTATEFSTSVFSSLHLFNMFLSCRPQTHPVQTQVCINTLFKNSPPASWFPSHFVQVQKAFSVCQSGAGAGRNLWCSFGLSCTFTQRFDLNLYLEFWSVPSPNSQTFLFCLDNCPAPALPP